MTRAAPKSRSDRNHSSDEAGQCPWSEGPQEGGCVKSGSMQHTPARVPTRAKQAGEIHARWAWVEASVWTDRMLTALENGAKGGMWFSLVKTCR